MGFNFFDKKKFIMVLIVLFTAAMVIFPKITEAGSKTAIIIWANSIVPVLLPFFIFSDFIKRTGDLEKLPARVYPLAVAFLSGYPMGAKVVGDLMAERKLGYDEGKWVLSYSLITGPAFMVATIGGFLGSTKSGIIVAASHYAAALINGLIYKKSFPVNTVQAGKLRRSKSSYLDDFTKSITSGFKAVAMILAYLILFMIGINLLEGAGLFGLINNQVINSAVTGLMEMTVGTSMLGACNISMELKIVISSFIVSFGGFSVICQSASMAEGSGLKFKDILEVKVTHGIIGGIVAALIVIFV